MKAKEPRYLLNSDTEASKKSNTLEVCALCPSYLTLEFRQLSKERDQTYSQVSPTFYPSIDNDIFHLHPQVHTIAVTLL